MKDEYYTDTQLFDMAGNRTKDTFLNRNKALKNWY